MGGGGLGRHPATPTQVGQGHGLVALTPFGGGDRPLLALPHFCPLPFFPAWPAPLGPTQSPLPLELAAAALVATSPPGAQIDARAGDMGVGWETFLPPNLPPHGAISMDFILLNHLFLFYGDGLSCLGPAPYLCPIPPAP